MPEKTVATSSGKPARTDREITRAQERYIQPPVDIYEKPEGLVLLADLPGVELQVVGPRPGRGEVGDPRVVADDLLGDVLQGVERRDHVDLAVLARWRARAQGCGEQQHETQRPFPHDNDSQYE